MTDTSHLNALHVRLSHETARLARSKTAREREMRTVWVAQIEKEIAGEYKFLGISSALPEMTDDELLAELLA